MLGGMAALDCVLSVRVATLLASGAAVVVPQNMRSLNIAEENAAAATTGMASEITADFSNFFRANEALANPNNVPATDRIMYASMELRDAIKPA